MLYKTAYLVILCCSLMHMTMIGSDVGFFHTVNKDGTLAYFISQAVAYLLYPLLGWLADVYFTRYKFILSSFITMIVGTVFMILTAALFIAFNNARAVLFILGGLSLNICLIGMGLFESTAIQFGMDQMLEASSEQLSTFIQWYYWSCNVGRLILMYVSAGVLEYYSSCTIDLEDQETENIFETLHPYYFAIACTAVLIMGGLQLVSAVVGLCLLVYSKKHFNIDRTGEHPLKLIFNVLKYSWNHKCPENRSAFTYWEDDIPLRIDLGKNKYGGPFTTEEVEDTKTFFRIILLLLTLLGIHLSEHGYSVLKQLLRKQCPSHWVGLFNGDPMHFTLIVIIFGVPLFQLCARCCGRKYFPNMLKRMGIGIFLCLVKEVVEISLQVVMAERDDCRFFDNGSMIDSCYMLASEFNLNGTCLSISEITDNFYHCEENNLPFFLLLVPFLLQGLSYLLVFMTALEFICAQAPLRLKGLLIGVWYASFAANYVLVEIPGIFIDSGLIWLIFHSVKGFLIAFTLMMYFCVSKKYQYRQRDEIVNEQFLVEEIYERELARAEEYEERERQEIDTLLERIAEQNRSYGAISSPRLLFN